MSETRILEHIRSDHFRIVSIDNAACSTVLDLFGVKITLYLTKVIAESISEKMTLTAEGGLEPRNGEMPETRLYRSLEFAAELRPDHALLVAGQILSALKQLPDNRKQQYGIPLDILPPSLIVDLAGE